MKQNKGAFIRSYRGIDYWSYDFWIEGKRYRGRIAPTSAINKRKANAKLRELMVEAARNSYIQQEKPKPAMTTAQVFEAYDAYLEHYRPKTFRTYKYSRQNFKPFFQRFNPVEDQHVQEYVDKRIAEGISGPTINRELAYCRAAFNRVKKKIGYNPFDDRPRFKEHDRVRYLKPDELGRLLKCCKGRLKDVVTVAILTGLRKENLLSLHRSQIDFDNGLIFVQGADAKDGDNESYPMSPEVAAILKRRLKRSDWVFESGHRPGRPLQDVRRAWRTALKEAGISNFVFHDLRHTFATYQLLKTGDLRTVQANLGHARVTTTQKYAHVLMGQRRAGAEAVAEYISDLTDD